jgi:hypothetical protein
MTEIFMYQWKSGACATNFPAVAWSSLKIFSDFPFYRIGFSTFSESNLLGKCCNLGIY